MKTAATPEAKKKALHLVKNEGLSIRAAAAAAGVPHSSLHDWIRRGEPAYDTEPTPAPSVADTEDEAARRMEQASQTGTEADPTMGMPPALKPGEEQGTPPTNADLEDKQPDLTTLGALYRYVNLTANDVAHHVAVEAARRISPNFDISTDHHRRIRNALGKGDEPVRLSEKARRQVPGNKGVMIALIPPGTAARQLAEVGDEPVDQIHMTLAYLGKSDEYEPAQLDELRAVLAQFAWSERPISCQASGTGRFRAGGDAKDAWYCSVDAPALPGMRERMMQALWAAGFYPSQLHGFSPHMTMEYLERDAPTPDDKDVPTPAWISEALTVAVDEDWDDLPFRQRMSEQLDFANIAPPSYVQDTYARWEMTDAQARTLADDIYATRLDGYAAAINDQLQALGRPMVASVSHPDVLAQLRQEANTSSAQILQTYNRDLASEVYTQYIELRGTLGRQTSEYQLDQATQTWIDDRAEWKAKQVAANEFGAAYSAGLGDFLSQNSLNPMGHVEPPDAQCTICQEAIDMGTAPADELNSIIPPHIGCSHEVVLHWEEGAVDPGADVWTGQESPMGEAAA
jgi:2'-5' RNA ligase